MANKTHARRHTARGPADGENWQAVADALNERMAARRIGQQRLAEAAGVSVSTIRVLQRNVDGRRVQNLTLTALCRALGWPDDHLVRVLLGERHAPDSDAPVAPAADIQADILAVLLRIERRVDDIARSLTPA
ncbi:helix-turn-helix domain-containing protein [Frankia sp. CNm7]|uniref:Helix-turn-helix domain-containing protein n=1 Tax=Frankia nepalensis TaxID=1836974 RepID=A0A937UPX0_9ACTN|nr:helix-turn-helix transcriptional regulator [Frankia nepalensis]MBL7500325.1 helix-turn-helix domain-containing protein [Frankia nepalensis]MBL7508547.1 helix-turn-helix domain-containing protein [Frankia nepalensis]MBL7521249.1 helix-turn-helix domain-containing protein [Frankia nepalensis]MBL7627675.1 helix-turn-helix domain-containing protein [Frankia nepalensis]